MGTPDYMSPEQVRAEKVDARADVFSVGAVLYHLLAQRKPFEAQSVHSILYEVLERDPPNLVELVPDLPPLVPPIVTRALQKDPAKRFQSAAAMRDALRDARRALAAGRAAAAALIPGAEGEATITRFDGLSPTYPSVPTSSSLSVRPAGSMPPTTSPPAASSAGSASPPTIAVMPGTLIQGATALELPAVEPGEASTERPEATFVAPPPGPGRTLAIGGAVLVVLLLGGGGFWWYSAQQSERQRQALIYALADQQLETARTELENKAYSRAIEEAEAVLARDSGNIVAEEGAREVLDGAKAALSALEAATLATREAYNRGDLKTASDELTRVLNLDPRHPMAEELGPALKSQFQTRVEQARSQAAGLRRAAESAKAAALPAFAEADVLVKRAEAQVAAGEYLDATKLLTQAGDTFERARRDAVAAAREAERKAAEERTAREAREARAIPSRSPSLPATRPSASVSPSVSPLASSGGQTLPPPGSNPITLPAPPSSAVTPPAGTPAPSAATLGAESAVQGAIAAYVRAMNGKDIALFKTVKPNASKAEVEGLEASFKKVKLEVNLAVNRVVLDPSGTRAQVFTTRNDVVAGQTMKPREQVFTMVAQGSTWIIERWEFPK
jgi:hypothetical protein